MIAERIALWSGLPPRAQGPAFLVSLGHLGTHWVAATFLIMLPWIQGDLGLTYLAAGTLVSVFHFSSFTANFLSGALTDVTGRRVLLQTGALAVGAMALAGMALAPGFVTLALLVGLIGATNNAWHPPAISFLSALYPRNRGYALAVHALGANVGDAVAPLFVGVLLGALAWRATATASALPVLAMAALILVMLGERDRAVAAAAPGRGGLGDYGRALKALIADQTVRRLALMAGFRTAAQQGLLMFVPLYLATELGASPFVTGFGFAAMQTGGVLFGPVAGAWSDRIGRRPIVVGGLTASTVVIALLSLAGNEVLFISGITVLGFLLFAVRPVVHSWMMDVAPPQVAGAMTSVVFGVQSLFSIAVPLVGGVIADAYGVAAVFTFLAGLMLVSNLIVWRLPEARPTE